jgi:MFS family permease
MTYSGSSKSPPDSGSASVNSWGAFGYRDFRYFWASGFFQGIARTMRDTLTFLIVFQLSGSALALGITGVFQAIPAILFGLLGGAMADAMDRKKLLIYTQMANVVAGSLLAFLVLFDFIEVWHIWLFASFWTGVHILGRPAQRAYMPRLVPANYLMNAITWFGALSQGTQIFGALAAGFIAAFVGVGWAFVVNAAVLAIALLTILPIRASGRPEGDNQGVSFRTVWEGVQFVRMKEVLVSSFVLDFGVMSVGFIRPILTILALEVFMVGEMGLGVMNAATAAGSVLGTFILLKIGNVDRKGAVILAAYGLYSVGLLGLGAASWVPGDTQGLQLFGISLWFLAALVALTVMGSMDVVAFTLKQSMIQLVAPDQFRGRASSLSSILSVLGNATGAVENGAIAAVFGAPGAIVINSFIALGVTGAVGARWRGLWRYRDVEG